MAPALAWTLLVASGFAAGAVNALAGGGTLLTYPSLLASGLAPIAANATSTVALVPGSLAAFWGYRGTLRRDRRLLVALLAPSAVGATFGALLVLEISNRTFALLVPWLILGATALFVLQGRLQRGFSGPLTEAQPATGRALAIVAVAQLVVAVYGAFFGAGMGILMLAVLGLAGLRDLHRMNGLKALAAVVINGVGAVIFVVGRRVEWRPATAVALAAIAGGYVGARLAQRVSRARVRGAVIAIGVAAAAVSFWKLVA